VIGIVNGNLQFKCSYCVKDHIFLGQMRPQGRKMMSTAVAVYRNVDVALTVLCCLRITSKRQNRESHRESLRDQNKRGRTNSGSVELPT